MARYGGEEFLILTLAMVEAQVQDFANTVVQRIADLKIPHEASPTKFLTISLGFTCSQPKNNEDLGSAIKRADQALYSAKAYGKNRAVGYESIG